jgi:F0F1-type ATP synthase assembly protein I
MEVKMSIAINSNLKKSVNSDDTTGAYASILGLISKDRRLSTFETPTFAKYASDNLSKFWVVDDGETSFPAQDKWDNDLWKLICVELEYNFSKKKFDFIIDIMDFLRNNGHPDFQVKQDITATSVRSKKESEEEKKMIAETITLGQDVAQKIPCQTVKNINTEHKNIKSTTQPHKLKDTKLLFGAVVGAGIGLCAGAIIGAMAGKIVIASIIGIAVGASAGAIRGSQLKK